MKEDKIASGKPLLFVHPGHELYGSDRMLLLCLQAARKKYAENRIVVILPKEGLLSREILTIGNITILYRKIGAIRKYDIRRLNFSGIARILTFYRLIRFLNSFNFVYINTIIVIDYILAAHFCKTRVVIHVHEIPGKSSTGLFSYLLNFSGAELIFVSSAAKHSYRNLKNRSQAIIWNGCKAFQKTPGDNDPDSRIRILFIGRINSWKGQPLLIKALSLLSNEERERIRVRMVGDVYSNQSHLKNIIIQQIDKYELWSTVEVLPFTLNPVTFYNWSDVVVMPSLLPESFGLVAIEAMSLGKVVVAANHGGLTEIIQDNVSGILFEPRNENDLARKLSAIIDDPKMLYKIGEKAESEFNRKFTDDIFLNNLIEII